MTPRSRKRVRTEREQAAPPTPEVASALPVKNSRIAPVFAASLLALMVVVVYFPAVLASFLWDDNIAIQENPLLKSARGLWTLWTKPFSLPLSHYFPMTYTAFWFEYQLWDARPMGYHVINILSHAANVAILYFLLRRMRFAGAWLAAALFAIHPVQAASVAWVIEFKNILCGLFYLLALWAWFSCEEKRKWPQYALALTLFVCAILSKTIAVTLPAAILILAWRRTGRIEKRTLIQMIPFLILAVAFSWLGTLAHHSGGKFSYGLSPVDKCLIAGRALWFYAGKLVWPLHQMGVYPQWKIDSRQAWQYLFPLAAVAVLVALWALRERIGRGPLAAALFFAISLCPILGFVEYSVMDYSYVHDHHQYLACIGLFVLFAEMVNRKISDQPWARRPFYTTVAGACVLAPLAFLSWRQAALHKDIETFFRHNLAENPAAWPAYNNVGFVLLEKGDLKEAERMFRKALELKPNRHDALSNLGSALLQQGKPTEALVYLDKAVELQPSNAKYLNAKGTALKDLGRRDEAKALFERALSLNPDLGEARNNLASLLIEDGKTQEARSALSSVLSSQPNAAPTQATLGMLLAKEGNWREAAAHYREAYRLQPGNPAYGNNLAWILATCPVAELRSPTEAVELAEAACQRDGYQNPGSCDTLASAYASAGRFEEAVKTQRKAVDLARAQGMTSMASELEARLGLFKNGRAFIEGK